MLRRSNTAAGIGFELTFPSFPATPTRAPRALRIDARQP